MKPRSKRTLAAASAALAVAGGGGAAIAASGVSTAPSSFLDDVAKHLGISSQKLMDATKAAAIDQVDEALKAGTITKTQADELKARIKAGELLPFVGPGFRAEHFGFRKGPGLFRFHEHLFAFGDRLGAASDYLGLTVAELRSRLAKGQSLADVAKAQGKSVDGLEQAILNSTTKKLDAAVSAGTLTKDQEKEILAEVKEHLDDLVNATFRGPGPGLRFFRGPDFGPRPFGPRPDGPPFLGPAA